MSNNKRTQNSQKKRKNSKMKRNTPLQRQEVMDEKNSSSQSMISEQDLSNSSMICPGCDECQAQQQNQQNQQNQGFALNPPSTTFFQDRKVLPYTLQQGQPLQPEDERHFSSNGGLQGSSGGGFGPGDNQAF